MSARIVSDERVARFVGDRCGTVIYPPFTAIGEERDGRIVAGMVFNCFTGPDIAVTMAVDRAGLSRALLRAAGDYVFRKCGCIRVSITTEQPHVISIAHRLAAQTEGTKRNHFGKDRDGTVLGILREDWKF